MKEIICPYCCEKFMPDKVHFRLNRPAVQEQGNGFDQEEEENIMGIPMQNRSKRQTASDSEGGRILDERLYQYYVDFLGRDRRQATEDATLYSHVIPDYDSSKFTYDELSFSKEGYVTQIRYGSQLLTKRLCPHCHNELIPGAGRDDMILISVIGDTNVGKTVYMTVLLEMLQQDPYFRGALQFAGSSADRENYLGNFKQLMREKMLLPGTERVKIPPLPFYYSYNYIDERGEEREKNAIVIFYDIAGEDCRDKETMEKNGYNIKYSSGLLFLVDPTRFSSVRLMVGDDNTIDSRYVVDIFGAINQFFVANSYERKANIPTAILLTKSDTLKEIPYFNDPDTQGLVYDEREVHNGYMDEGFIAANSEKIRGFIGDMKENVLLNNAKLFTDVEYFMVSALGKKPSLIEDRYSESQYIGVKGAIEPFRVTDPFYWILMKHGIISKRYHEEIEDSTDGQTIDIYYNEKDPEELLIERINTEYERVRKENKTSLFSNLFKKNR